MTHKFTWVLVVSALIVACLAGFYIKTTNEKLATLEKTLEVTRQDATAALSSVMSPEMMRNVDDSVYMVRIDEFSMGSAFVIDRDRGILATAAHVIDAMDFDNAEEFTFTVINQHSGKALPIISGRMHAGYREFTKLVKSYEPIAPQSWLLFPRGQATTELPHDAGLLLVDPIDPDTGVNILGPNLPIASQETLLSLQPGDPAAVLGFPGNVINSRTQGESAKSRIGRGIITALTSPIDQVEENENTITQNLIVHRIGLAGGNSGGPLINLKGEVIGINTHGVSSMQSTGDGIAQRADVISDMLIPLREEENLEKIYLPDWRKRLKRYLKAEDILPKLAAWMFLEYEGRQENHEHLTALDLTNAPEYKVRALRPEFETHRRFEYLAKDLQVKKDPTPEEEKEAKNLKRRGIVKYTNSKVFSFNKVGDYAFSSQFLSRRKNHAIIAFDYAVNAPYGSCRLEIFHRQRGEDVFEPLGRGYVVARRFRTSLDRKISSRHEFVFRRSNRCSTTDDFYFAIISWDKPKKPITKKTAATKLSDDTSLFISALMEDWQDTKQTAANFTNCTIPMLGDRNACMKPVHAVNPIDLSNVVDIADTVSNTHAETVE